MTAHRAMESCDCQPCRDAKALGRALSECQALLTAERQRREQAEVEHDEAKRDWFDLLKKLKDGDTVHANMLRGCIATPTIRQMLHLHGEDAIAKWDRVEQAEQSLSSLRAEASVGEEYRDILCQERDAARETLATLRARIESMRDSYAPHKTAGCEGERIMGIVLGMNKVLALLADQQDG